MPHSLPTGRRDTVLRDGGAFFLRMSREKDVQCACSEQIAKVGAECVEEHGLGGARGHLAIGLRTRADFASNLQVFCM